MPINNVLNKNKKENSYRNIWEKNFLDKNIDIIKNINDENINSLNELPKSPTGRGTCRDWKEEVNRDNYSDGSSPLAIPIVVFFVIKVNYYMDDR